MSVCIQKEYAKQVELTKWIDEQFKVELPAEDRRTIFSITCFDLTIEHHAAMCILCNARLYGTMLALLRILFEAFVRGLWLRYSATTEDIDKYEREKLNITFGTMITLVESSIAIDTGPLSTLKSSSWKLINSFTHSGFQHILRRNADGETGPVNYNASEVCSALNLAGTFSLLSSVELASFSGNHELVTQALLKAEEYAAN